MRGNWHAKIIKVNKTSLFWKFMGKVLSEHLATFKKSWRISSGKYVSLGTYSYCHELCNIGYGCNSWIQITDYGLNLLLFIFGLCTVWGFVWQSHGRSIHYLLAYITWLHYLWNIHQGNISWVKSLYQHEKF